MGDEPRQLSPAEAREQFRAAGVSVSEWARAQGFNRGQVYQVLSGTIKGNRGVGHRIAVALGLKPPSAALPGALPSATPVASSPACSGPLSDSDQPKK